MAEPRKQIYGSKRPAGYLLAHNFVRPAAADQKPGVNGFRRFWIPPEWVDKGKWKACDCGWRPDLGIHYHSTVRPF
jgi:hypothetical protein